MNRPLSIAVLALTTSLALTPSLTDARERFNYGGVYASTRPSLVDLGQVVAFQNQYPVTLRNCYFAVEGKSNLHNRTHYGPIFLTAAIQPGEALEVGWIELQGNWLLLPDDVVYLRCDNVSEDKWTLSGNRQAYINKIKATYGD